MSNDLVQFEARYADLRAAVRALRLGVRTLDARDRSAALVVQYEMESALHNFTAPTPPGAGTRAINDQGATPQ